MSEHKYNLPKTLISARDGLVSGVTVKLDRDEGQSRAFNLSRAEAEGLLVVLDEWISENTK